MRSGLRPAALGLVLALAVGAAAGHASKPRSAAELMDVLMWNREPIGGPFALVDHQGRKRTEADYRGKLLLVYFGYSTCADICPTDLQQIGAAIESLGSRGDSVQPIFITLDPERDTPRRLAAYVPAFHPRLVGLGGSLAAVRNAAAAYRVYFRKAPIGKAGDYAIDHSAVIFMMDREGKYIGFFPPSTPASRMAEMMRPYL